MYTLPCVVVIFILPLFILLWREKWKLFAPLPPGPFCLPLVGNIFNIPKDYSWKTYLDWSKSYGSDILYTNILGTHVIVINSRQIATDLLIKHWRIHSSRPPSYMTSCLMECDWFLACMSYTNTWRTSRRLLAKYFSRSVTGSRMSSSAAAAAAAGFTDIEWQRPHVIKYTHYFLRNLLQDPDSFMEHTFKLAASVAVSSSYGGLGGSLDQDDCIPLVRRASDILSFALDWNASWVALVPFLRLMRNWMKLKQLARLWREEVKRYLVVPFIRAKRNFIRRNHNVEMPFILSQELTTSDSPDHRVLQEALANVPIGATSTTSAALKVFFLTMTLNPETQKQAQMELNSLLTRKAQQLPTHADLEDLPFCMAVVYEVLRDIPRWHVVTPIGLPHFSVAEDVYEGYRIPKGSVIIPNIWAMMRDPVQFKDPSEFRPGRFLNADGKLDKAAVKKIDPVFGFGRRVCVGRSLALSILAYTACCVLAVFDIQQKVDDKGEPIVPCLEFESSIISSPLPFVCLIKPRSPETENFVLDLFEDSKHVMTNIRAL